jgi:hypothetical protein
VAILFPPRKGIISGNCPIFLKTSCQLNNPMWASLVGICSLSPCPDFWSTKPRVRQLTMAQKVDQERFGVRIEPWRIHVNWIIYRQKDINMGRTPRFHANSSPEWNNENTRKFQKTGVDSQFRSLSCFLSDNSDACPNLHKQRPNRRRVFAILNISNGIGWFQWSPNSARSSCKFSA